MKLIMLEFIRRKMNNRVDFTKEFIIITSIAFFNLNEQ